MSYSNFVQAKVGTAMTNSQTTVTLVAAVTPFQLPPADGGVLVLTDSLGSPSFVEIIKYTSRSGLVLSGVSRAQEGTTARAWPINSYCYQSLTAGDFSSQLSKASEWVVKTGNFTAVVNQKQFITDSSAVTMPAIAGLPQGASVPLGKALTATPVVQTTDGTLIKGAKASATSFNYDLNAPITLVLNGTAWEV